MDEQFTEDSFVCGLCRENSVNLIEFLTHKSHHVGPGKGLGCEFCGTFYTRQVTIREHYRKKHKIQLTTQDHHSQSETVEHKKRKRIKLEKSNNNKALTGIAVDCEVVLVGNDRYNGSTIMEPAIHTTGIKDIVKDEHIAIVHDPDYACLPFTGVEESYNCSRTGNSVTEMSYGIIGKTNIAIDPQLQQLPEDHESVVVVVVEEPHGSVSVIEEPHGSVAVIDEPHGSLAAVEEPHGSIAVVEESHGSVTVIEEPHGSVAVVAEPHGSVVVVNSHGNLEGSSDNIIHLSDNLISAGDNMLVTALEASEICSMNPVNQSLHNLLESNHEIVTSSTNALRAALVSTESISINSEIINPSVESSVENCANSEPLQSKMNCRVQPTIVNQLDLSQTGAQENIGTSIDDFYFILMTNLHKGSSFSYGKHCFKCLHCDYKTCWKSALCKHMTSKHEEIMKIHKCIETKSVITDENQKLIKFSEFVATHHFSKARKSSNKRIRGVEKQDLPGNYSCTKCKKVFSRLRYLRKHMTVHKIEQKFLCDECGKAFKTKTYLNSHRRTHKRESYKCSQCDFSSTINAAIHAHRQLHNDGSVLCDICGYAYTDKSTLTKHKKVHDLSRPFACKYPGCTWRFKTEVMCIAHYKAHTTEGKFKCSRCGYVFRHKHHLQRHEEKMHGIERTKLSSRKQQESVNIQNTVSYIVNTVETDMNSEQMRLETNQLVIATDADGNTVNYQVADIMTNVAYQTLLQGQDLVEDTDAHTIYTYIPTGEPEQIVLQQKNETEAEIMQT